MGTMQPPPKAKPPRAAGAGASGGDWRTGRGQARTRHAARHGTAQHGRARCWQAAPLQRDSGREPQRGPASPPPPPGGGRAPAPASSTKDRAVRPAPHSLLMPKPPTSALGRRGGTKHPPHPWAGATWYSRHAGPSCFNPHKPARLPFVSAWRSRDPATSTLGRQGAQFCKGPLN